MCDIIINNYRKCTSGLINIYILIHLIRCSLSIQYFINTKVKLLFYNFDLSKFLYLFVVKDYLEFITQNKLYE